MDLTNLLFAIAIISCIYMACNIGANDVANAMGTTVGSKSLTFRQAIIIAAVAEFAGAFFVGGHVSQTIRKEILNPTIFSDFPLHLVYGMIASLIASAIWLHLASSLGWPVSTTHAIIGAVAGFGIAAGGWGSINWLIMRNVVLSWFVSPIMGAFISFLMFRFIYNRIFNKRNPLERAKTIIPYLSFLVCVILVNAVVYKGLKNLHLELSFSRAFPLSMLMGIVGLFLARKLVGRIETAESYNTHQQLISTENVFKYLQGITAFYIAFAHGSNDVANAVGPLAAVVSILYDGEIPLKVPMPLWILALGGGCIVLGLVLWGARVIRTVGEKITEITPSRGFCATFGAATVVLLCSKLGLPISTTHTLVGSVIGVGLARGLATLDLSIVTTIIASWFATVPFTAVISIMIYELFIFILG